MEEEFYYLIRNSDGDTYIHQYTKEEILKVLNEEHVYSNIDFFNNMPLETDTNYWGENVLLIKGKIVKPEPKTKITTFDID